MATCGPTTVSRDVHGKRPLTWRLKTAALETTVITTTFICVKWLASETIVMKSKQRPRHRLKRSLVNWRKRKRHWRKTMRMPSWGTRSLPPVTPTDRPPPELSNLSCSVYFRDEKC
ncbi:hypothetical protein Bpfe_004948 [Biomphalaria pfeifferi]|uniref:Uncharacterized protein n=1 Tax=Biomphalaria pfeifferi TaxID=112525 RepID=A0AAD8C3H1_BIOPF|nr:hypothetical protein Bpfe_004948 [Biomphalaria pfeifferi]